MSNHINNPAPGNRNFWASSLRYVADQIGVDPCEARMIISKMNNCPWLDAPVVSYSAGHLPESEDGIHKYGYYIE